MLEQVLVALDERIGVLNSLLERLLAATVTALKPTAGASTPAAVNAAAPAATPATEAATPAVRTRKPRATNAALIAAISGAATATASLSTATPAGMPETTLDDVKLAIVALAKKKGRVQAEAVLGGFHVDHADKLKPSDYDKCIDALNHAAAAA